MTEAFWGDGLVWLRRAAGMVDGVAQADVRRACKVEGFVKLRVAQNGCHSLCERQDIAASTNRRALC